MIIANCQLTRSGRGQLFPFCNLQYFFVCDIALISDDTTGRTVRQLRSAVVRWSCYNPGAFRLEPSKTHRHDVD